MQISKTLLTCGAAALCLVAVSARATDAETNAKLREALHQKMAELGPETSAPEPAPAPAKPAKVKTPKTTKPAAPVAPKAATPAVAAPVKPAPVKPAPVTPPPAPKPAARVAPAPAVVAPVVVQPAPPAAPAQPVTTAVDDAQAARLREAVRTRLGAESTTPTPPPSVVAQPPTTTAAPVEPKPEVKSPTKDPVAIPAPAPPIFTSKEQRLANLLQQYKSDQITPQAYHEQRAKIIAE